jgi:hypothetical protein
MGREAVCTCDWAGTVAEVKALLETAELILRGDIRKRVPFAAISKVKVEGDCLRLTVGHESVELHLGASQAAKWAAVIASPPASLAKKLGITNKTVVQTIGPCNDENLRAAIGEAGRISSDKADLIVACVDTPEALHAALEQAKTQLLSAIPIWMVYRKRPRHALKETAIRSLLRSKGMMDTKVASVSMELTALRFSVAKS